MRVSESSIDWLYAYTQCNECLPFATINYRRLSLECAYAPPRTKKNKVKKRSRRLLSCSYGCSLCHLTVITLLVCYQISCSYCTADEWEVWQEVCMCVMEYFYFCATTIRQTSSSYSHFPYSIYQTHIVHANTHAYNQQTIEWMNRRIFSHINLDQFMMMMNYGVLLGMP